MPFRRPIPLITYSGIFTINCEGCVCAHTAAYNIAIKMFDCEFTDMCAYLLCGGIKKKKLQKHI